MGDILLILKQISNILVCGGKIFGMSISGKSIRFSIYSVLLTIAVLIGCVFLFKVHFLMVLIGVVCLLFPAKLQRIALDEASGTIDKVIAKYIVPALAVVAMLAVVFSLAFWIKI